MDYRQPGIRINYHISQNPINRIYFIIWQRELKIIIKLIADPVILWSKFCYFFFIKNQIKIGWKKHISSSEKLPLIIFDPVYIKMGKRLQKCLELLLLQSAKVKHHLGFDNINYFSETKNGLDVLFAGKPLFLC